MHARTRKGKRAWEGIWICYCAYVDWAAVVHLQSKMALGENLTNTVGQLCFIWNFSDWEAPDLKMYMRICYSSFFHSVHVNLVSSSDRIAKIDKSEITVHRVFSASLNPEKTWFALNSILCCTKPSMFCSSATAKLFHGEYALVSFEDLRGKDGVPASSKWFHSKRLRSDKMHVATAFGLILGILRFKTLEDCPFIKSQYFESVVSLLNAKAFDLDLESSRECTPELIRLKSRFSHQKPVILSFSRDFKFAWKAKVFQEQRCRRSSPHSAGNSEPAKTLRSPAKIQHGEEYSKSIVSKAGNNQAIKRSEKKKDIRAQKLMKTSHRKLNDKKSGKELGQLLTN